MKKLIAALVLVIGLAFNVNAYEKGDLGLAAVVCTVEAAKAMAATASQSKEKANALAKVQLQSGDCAVLPAPAQVELVEKVVSFVDFDNDTVEVWTVKLVGEKDEEAKVASFFFTGSNS